ncbi:MAG: hypothetical protein CMC91_02705 [Flavobacteriaceae bacterium]|nr:hypothetical protein [Flavobacteriaceae bacterium]
MISCSDFNTNINDEIIASVDSDYLYLSDFQKSNHDFKTKKDSLLAINSYINKWALNQILFRQSLINLSEEKLAKINDLVENYKFDLMTNNYTEFVVSSKLDTILTSTETFDFYKKNRANFKLNEPIYRVKYVNFLKNNVDRRGITRSFKRFNNEDKRFIDSLSFQFLDFFLADTIWLNQGELIKNISFINSDNFDDFFLKKRKYFEIKGETDLSLFSIIESIEANEFAPFPYVKNIVENIVLNKRKLDLIENFNNEILNDAIKTKKFQVYEIMD